MDNLTVNREDKIRIGIIGAGAIVEGNHLPALSSLPQSEPVWIFDKNQARASLVSKMYGIRSLKEDAVEQALQEVDVCLLATPYGTRKFYIDLCRKAGKALVVEKPFAFSREEHLKHCEGFREWEISVNFQRRFYRSVAVLRQIIEEKMFGRLRQIRFVQGNFTLKGGSGYLSSVELAGGGIIAESCSHILDIILSITAAKEVELQHLEALHMDGLEYDAVFDTRIISPENELSVHCEISTLRNLDNGLFLEFDNASVRCDLSPDGVILLQSRDSHRVGFSLAGEPSWETMPLQATGVNEAFLIFWEQFLLGIRQQQPNKTSAYDSILTSFWIGEIYKKINSK